MHYYRLVKPQSPDQRTDKYEVWFSHSDGDIRFIREFLTEDEAAAYVSYLNGGTEPRLTQRQLATLAPRRT